MSHRRLRLALLLVVVAVFAGAGAAAACGAGEAQRAAAVARERASVVGFARRFVGVRYSYGGTSPATGFDCSGFTRFVYAHFGIDLPHYSGAQFEAGRRVASPGALRPGDLVFFDGLGHVGLYVGDGLFIHAPHTGARVSVDPLTAEPGFDGARRLL
jgi:cell wall-associated NlpC family hydrolase